MAGASEYVTRAEAGGVQAVALVDVLITEAATGACQCGRQRSRASSPMLFSKPAM